MAILGQLDDLVLGLLEGSLQVDNLPRVGRTRDVVRKIWRGDLVLGQLTADVADLAFHLLASSDLAGILALENIYIGV